MTVFEQVTASPEALGELLASLMAVNAPWESHFQRTVCPDCEHYGRDCGDVCPHEAERNNPLWWLNRLAGQEVPLEELPEPLREMKETFPAVKIYRETHTSGTMKGKLQFLECGAGLMMELGKLLFPDGKEYRAIIKCDPAAGLFEATREDIVSKSAEPGKEASADA